MLEGSGGGGEKVEECKCVENDNNGGPVVKSNEDNNPREMEVSAMDVATTAAAADGTQWIDDNTNNNSKE
ncbi:hypothetical protein TYRP_013048 [Tyrophagus putrescentiae]|nr:hypothetical protein TYRP_013048 [Tyrophagus putrescentiae]